MKEKEGTQISCAQLVRELEKGKQAGEDKGWMSPEDVREHFSESEEKEFGYTEFDYRN